MASDQDMNADLVTENSISNLEGVSGGESRGSKEKSLWPQRSQRRGREGREEKLDRQGLANDSWSTT